MFLFGHIEGMLGPARVQHNTDRAFQLVGDLHTTHSTRKRPAGRTISAARVDTQVKPYGQNTRRTSSFYHDGHDFDFDFGRRLVGVGIGGGGSEPWHQTRHASDESRMSAKANQATGRRETSGICSRDDSKMAFCCSAVPAGFAAATAAVSAAATARGAAEAAGSAFRRTIGRLASFSISPSSHEP